MIDERTAFMSSAADDVFRIFSSADPGAHLLRLKKWVKTGAIVFHIARRCAHRAKCRLTSSSGQAQLNQLFGLTTVIKQVAVEVLPLPSVAAMVHSTLLP